MLDVRKPGVSSVVGSRGEPGPDHVPLSGRVQIREYSTRHSAHGEPGPEFRAAECAGTAEGPRDWWSAWKIRIQMTVRIRP
jgi:hypothetical protein